MIAPPEWWSIDASSRKPGAWSELLRVIGLRRPFSVDGVSFLERGGEPLKRALSLRGRGFKEYSVEFPSGEPMRIRATSQRFYPDLIGQRMPRLARTVEHLVRPGMRILISGAGTGQGAAWVALCVGASGGVVALERDGESVRFSRRRYPAANISFEIGGAEALSGELNGAFDGVIALGAPDQPQELWRVVAERGWMLAGEAVLAALRQCEPSVGPLAEALSEPGDPDRIVLIRKPRLIPAEPGTEAPSDETGPP